jgi:two-component system, chemotaxis family, chemotaxis protein CheY
MSSTPDILVVDDSKVSRMLIRAMIAATFPEARIAEAAEANQAQAAVAAQRFDLAILDMNMPGMNGLDLASSLLSHSNAPQRVCMLSANVQDATRQRAEERGVLFFRKPVSEPVIAEILATLSH